MNEYKELNDTLKTNDTFVLTSTKAYSIEDYKETENYTSLTANYIFEKAQKDKTVVAITAGTPGVFGFNSEYRTKMGEQYTDVGIAEEHAVAYSSALAKCGAKPIFCVMSSFVQRTYDQMSQDLCLNNSPITMLVHWGGLSGADSTHLCSFDMSLISNIPNMVYLAPTCKEEYQAMLEYSYNQNEYPVAIRVPAGALTSCGEVDTTDYSKLNKFKLVEKGEKVAILGLGNFFALAREVKEALKTQGIDATLINPKFITGVDKDLLEDLKANHSVVVTIEDGMLDGGFGEKIARYFGNSNIKVLNYGSYKEFINSLFDILESTEATTLTELFFEKFNLICFEQLFLVQTCLYLCYKKHFGRLFLLVCYSKLLHIDHYYQHDTPLVFLFLQLDFTL